MINRLWSAVASPFFRTPKFVPPPTVVMTTQCRDGIAEKLRWNIQRRHEGIIYFVGLTNEIATLALWGTTPESTSTPGSVDVTADELGKIIRSAALSGLQVVGQLHTHPEQAHHSPGDLVGMRIRHPGYFSIVVPQYGIHLPSFQHAHTLMWSLEGFRNVTQPIKFIEGVGE